MSAACGAVCPCLPEALALRADTGATEKKLKWTATYFLYAYRRSLEMLAVPLGASWPWLAAVSAVFLAALYRFTARRPGCAAFALHPLCPAFISGAYAATEIGTDEVAFLRSLKRDYGDIVYIPFPVGRYFVVGDALIRKIYSGVYNEQMSFNPIRVEFGRKVFGIAKEVTRQPVWEETFFPLHHKYMAKSKMGAAIARFADAIEGHLQKEQERLRSSGPMVVDLIQWTTGLVNPASIVALFGTELPIPVGDIQSWCKDFDQAFPLLSSGLIPLRLQPYFKPGGIAQGVSSRGKLNACLGRWARETRCSGLEEEDVVRVTSDFITKMAFDDNTLGGVLNGHIFALLVNNPYAICWVLLYLIHADQILLDELHAEIETIPSGTPASDADLPLLQSVFYETLRLYSSAYSARYCFNEVNVDGQARLLPGETLVCATRLGHLDKEIWGDDAEVWDPKRFYDDPRSSAGLTDAHKARKIAVVRAFGGGVSMVSEADCALLFR